MYFNWKVRYTERRRDREKGGHSILKCEEEHHMSEELAEDVSVSKDGIEGVIQATSTEFAVNDWHLQIF